MQVCDFHRSTGTFRIDFAKKPAITVSHSPVRENYPLGHRIHDDKEFFSHGIHILIEYPVRVWNYNERDALYQLDTGPVHIPNFSREHTRLIETFERAYISHNCLDWAEFIVNVPIRINDEIIVDHYSESRRLDQVKNRMIELLG